MQGIMYDHIQNLDKSRTNWRIKVRCTRFWQTVSNDNNAVKGYNFILLDDDNSHIHAYVYPNNWSAIGKEVVEGNVYVFQNFQVRDSTGKLKPVSTKLCIRLLSSTTIEEQSNDHLIPRYKFEFMDFGDINEESKKVVGDENPEYAIDIIGVIEHFDKMKKIDTRIGKREVTRFVISDGSIPHKVTLWGELAIAVSSDYYKPEIEQPVICILTSAKIGTFMDNVSVGTLPSTRVFFNLDIEPVVEFRNRLIEGGYRPGVGNTNVSNNYAPTLEHVSFADLIANPETMFAKKAVLATFNVSKIEEEENFWFNSCTVCHNEVTRVEMKFKCEACNRSFPYSDKRFRILVLADDKTHACNVLLFDRIVKRLLGTTVTNILSEMKKSPDSGSVKEMYKRIIGKEISAKILLSEGNKSGESNIYEAVDLFDPTMLASSSGEKSPETNTSAFSHPGVVPGIELFQTPGSASSVSKKIKTEEDVVHIG